MKQIEIQVKEGVFEHLVVFFLHL